MARKLESTGAWPPYHTLGAWGAASALNVLITGAAVWCGVPRYLAEQRHLKDKRWNSTAGKHEWSGVRDLIVLTKT